MESGVYATVGRPSVCPSLCLSVCPIRPPNAAAAGLFWSAAKPEEPKFKAQRIESEGRILEEWQPATY